jgi:hypothetical protein
MGFLIRSAFWLSLVLLFLPIGSGSENGDVETVGPITAFLAAKDAVSDVAGICERKPDVCETGREVASTIAVKAREGARLVLAWVEEEERPAERVPMPSVVVASDTIVTGTVPLPQPAPAR